MASAAIIVPHAHPAVPIIGGDRKDARPRAPRDAGPVAQASDLKKGTGRPLPPINRPHTRPIVAPRSP